MEKFSLNDIYSGLRERIESLGYDCVGLENVTEDEMKKYILDHMARHKVPKYIDFVDSFPMNVAGKILKYKMREDAVERHGLRKAAEIETA